MKPLYEQEYQKFSNLDLVRIRTDFDNFSFFHALAKSFCIPYIEERLNGTPINRRQFAYQLYTELQEKNVADVLEKNIHVINGQTGEIERLNQKNVYEKSVIVLNILGHYELVGKMVDGKVYTLFDSRDDIVNKRQISV